MGVRVTPASDLADVDGLRALGDEPEAPTAPGSLVARLRERAAAVQRDRTFDLAVPGWQGELVLRFRPLPMGQLEQFVERAQSGRSSEVGEGIEAMAVCCVAVLGREGDRLVELADADGPVRLDQRLAVLLGMPMPPDATLTTREIVTFLFGGNAFALGQFVDRLVRWMSDPDTTEPPGES